MSDNIQPSDVKKSLDDYIKRKQDALDKEILESIQRSKKEICLAIEDKKEQMLAEIKNPKKKISLLSKFIGFIKSNKGGRNENT